MSVLQKSLDGLDQIVSGQFEFLLQPLLRSNLSEDIVGAVALERNGDGVFSQHFGNG